MTNGMTSVAPFEVGLVAADIDALLPFYRDVLGFALLSDIVAPAATSRAAGLAPDGYRVVRLESGYGDRIKLAQPSTRPSACPGFRPTSRRFRRRSSRRS